MKTDKIKMIMYIAGIAAGIALALAGVLLRDQPNKALMGICVGLGSGLFSMCAANLINRMIEKKHPETARKKAIEVNDERNALIRDKAGARANRALSLAIPVVTMIFVFMNVELAVTLIMCGLILLQAFFSIFYHDYFSKRI